MSVSQWAQISHYIVSQINTAWSNVHRTTYFRWMCVCWQKCRTNGNLYVPLFQGELTFIEGLLWTRNYLRHLTFDILFNTCNYPIIWALTCMIQWAVLGLSVYHLITFLELFHLPHLSIWPKDASTSGFCNSSLQEPNPSRRLCSSSCQPRFPRTGPRPTVAAQMGGSLTKRPLFLNSEENLHLEFLFWQTQFPRLDIVIWCLQSTPAENLCITWEVFWI